MKKIFYVLFIIFLFIINLNVKALNTKEKIYDYAQILTEEEENKLLLQANEFINDYNIDLVLVSVKYQTNSSTEDYAKNFYTHNNFGKNNTKDGIIFVIDFTYGSTDFSIVPMGNSMNIYTEDVIKNLLNDISKQYYKDKTDYYSIYNVFINSCINYKNSNVNTTNNNLKTSTIPIFKIFIISFLLTNIIFIIIYLRNKNLIKKNRNILTNNIIADVKILNKIDKFKTTHTVSERLSKDKYSESE